MSYQGAGAGPSNQPDEVESRIPSLKIQFNEPTFKSLIQRLIDLEEDKGLLQIKSDDSYEASFGGFFEGIKARLLGGDIDPFTKEWLEEGMLTLAEAAKVEKIRCSALSAFPAEGDLTQAMVKRVLNIAKTAEGSEIPCYALGVLRRQKSLSAQVKNGILSMAKSHEISSVRVKAIETLAASGRLPASIEEGMLYNIALNESEGEYVRIAAIRALGQQQRMAPTIVQGLKNLAFRRNVTGHVANQVVEVFRNDVDVLIELASSNHSCTSSRAFDYLQINQLSECQAVNLSEILYNQDRLENFSQVLGVLSKQKIALPEKILIRASEIAKVGDEAVAGWALKLLEEQDGVLEKQEGVHYLPTEVLKNLGEIIIADMAPETKQNRVYPALKILSGNSGKPGSDVEAYIREFIKVATSGGHQLRFELKRFESLVQTVLKAREESLAHDMDLFLKAAPAP